MRFPPVVTLLVLACSRFGYAQPAPYDHFFQSVKPLLDQKCVACHGTEKQEGGLRLDTADILKGGDSGPAVVPGKPDESLLIRAVQKTHEDLAMPPQEKLHGEQIAALIDWVKAGAVWVDPPIVLVEDEDVTFTTLGQGQSPPRLVTEDRFSGRAALNVSADELSRGRIGGWHYRIAEKPAPGEYRYLRFAWKKVGGGGAMLEVANDGNWPASDLPKGRYIAGASSKVHAAVHVSPAAPADWTPVTIDLWKDLGSFTLSGLAMATTDGRALFDSILLAPTLASLDTYKPGRGKMAVASRPTTVHRHGDAWTDPENPIAKLWGGARLDLWSLRRPARPQIPHVKQSDWLKNPIDNFVLDRLEQKNLRPSAETDRRTLIRRVTFDLTGLPPTPEEVRAFEQDTAGDAYERLVDRLLASPRYGEHWARHWLDVVRYADTNGFERDEYRATMYRYRDYVVRSLNADKPYDRFVTEQLAGDELAAGPADPSDPGNVERLVATGFMRLGPYDTASSIFDEDAKSRDQLMADLVNTTGSAFLGLTMSCCRCHDHKYDPFSQADHFRLQAFFAGVKFHEPTVEKSPPRQMIAETHAASLVQKRARFAELTALGSARALEKLRAALPADVRELATRDSAKLDAAERAKLAPYLDRLKVNGQQIRDALSPAEAHEREELVGEVDLHEKLIPRLDKALCMVDAGDTAPPTRILAQGDYQKPLAEVPPGFLSILDPNPAEVPPARGHTTGRRTVLAQWITSPENPLTARVIVNRLWQQHFGRGLVATPNDFGFSGTRPTHPELLDYLATELVARGWSLKAMHRLMVLSATYRQASAEDPAAKKIDPDNLLLWRQSPRRLEAEALRDAMLAVSGRLLPVEEGPAHWPQIPDVILRGNPKFTESPIEGWLIRPDSESYVRTVFTVQKRSLMQPLLESFDLPDPSVSCARRNMTTVAPQALMLLNSPFAVDMASSLAERAASEAHAQPLKTVERLFELALARAPDDEERELALDMLLRHTAAHAERLKSQPTPESGKALTEKARGAALADLSRVLINTSEFLYVD